MKAFHGEMMVTGCRRLQWLASYLALISPFALCNAHATAAQWPTRTLKLVVAQAPGAPPDIIARFVAQRLGPLLGTNVVVQNVAGASGTIGAEQVMHAPADGSTLLIATLSTHVLVPHTRPDVRYDPLRDFTPIANLYRSVKVLWVDAALPLDGSRGWMQYAKARPGELYYASGGVGSSNDIDARLFLAATGLAVVHVPYNGPAAGIAGVASGAAQMMIVSITTGLPLAQAGRVRPLLVFAAQRSPLLPDVPTAREADIGAVDLDAWIGLMGPRNFPPALLARVNAAVMVIVASDEARAWAAHHGLESAAGSAVEFAETLARDHARWGERLRSLNIAPAR